MTSQPIRPGRTDLLDRLRPRSVAVIGASPRKGRIGRRPVEALQRHRFDGPIYPVNPRYEEVLGLRCYPGLEQLPEVPEAMVVAVSGPDTVEVVRTGAALGVRLAVVVSSGFADVEGGEELQAELGRAVEGTDLRLIGPNTTGVMNFVDDIPLAMSSFLGRDEAVAGNIALVSQSGGLATTVIDRAQERGIGLSYFVAPGNSVDVTVLDVLEAVIDDPDTQVIGVVLEGLADGTRLRTAFHHAREAGKRVLALKLGRSDRGHQAAQSHTAGMVGSQAGYRAVFRETGVVEVTDPHQLIEFGTLFGRYPSRVGDRLGILSISGGGGALLADLAADRGLAVPELPPTVAETSRELLGRFTTGLNPLDLTGVSLHNPEVFGGLLEASLADDGFDAVVLGAFMVASDLSDRVGRDVSAVADRFDKPLIVVGMSGGLNRNAYHQLASNGVPVYLDPGRGMDALAALLRVPPVSVDVSVRSDQGQPTSPPSTRYVTELDAKRLLRDEGLPVVPGEVASAVGEATDIAAGLGYPVVAKATAPDLVHKSDVGAVITGIETSEQLHEAFERLRIAVPGCGVLVEQQVPTGVEALVSITPDPVFGPMLAIAIGGVLTEYFPQGPSLRPVPVKPGQVHEMLAESGLTPLLAGIRGRPPADVDAFVDFAVDLGELAARREEIEEIELNPVIVDKAGVSIVDALLAIRSEPVDDRNG